MDKAINTKGIHSLRVRISFLLVLAALLIASAISFVALGLFTVHTRASHLKIAKGVAMLASQAIDADSIEAYKKDGKTVPGYAETFERLKSLHQNIPDIEYLYAYQIREDGCHVIFDTDSENSDYGVDDLIEFDPTFLPYVPDLLEGNEIEPLESNDQYGWLLTYYHPVFNSKGECACYVGVDISMNLLRTYRLTFLLRTIILSFLIAILIVGIGLWISTKFLVNPINRISHHAISFMKQNGNLDGMSQCVTKIKSLDVRTGDEVENLYISFSNMTENTVRNIMHINHMQQERLLMMKKYNEELEKKVEERTKELRLANQKAENLLLNILPKDIAYELTEHPDRTIAKNYPDVTVLFTDIVGFTKMSGKMTAKNVVAMLNLLVSRFDERAKLEGIEKIKTIGDAYMAACGLTETPSGNEAVRMVKFARGLISDVEAFNRRFKTSLQIRIGINSGNLVAGVIGKTKFIYDIWGDTVNVASRMESTGFPMKIHVSEATYLHTKDTFSYGEEVDVEVKGKGQMKTYLL
ncbi:MAG TPA: hypothetical protein DCP61_00840 [Treponema sp.]|nr:hypothetical protein [Treponema sp.]